MDDVFGRIAEDKIREAIAKGQLDHLPGKGKPLILEDLSHIPEELRAGYKLLKNAGFVPEEVSLMKELVSLEELLRCCRDDEEKHRLRAQMNEKRIRYDVLMRNHGIAASPAFAQYEDKVRSRLLNP